MPKINDRRTRETRKATADMRAANPHAQTAEQKLARLDQRLGAGVGATKERARLTRQMSAQTNAKEA